MNVETANAAAAKILEEAESAAEQLKEHLPEVATAVSMREKTSVET